MSNHYKPPNNPSNPSPHVRQSTFREENRPQTFSDLLAEVKRNYFQEIYNDLLNLTESKNLDKIFAETERFAKEVGCDLSTHQLRRVYGEVVKVKNGEVQSLKMVRPNLAYMAARQDKKNINGKKVMALLDDLIKQVQTSQQLTSFKQFMEALVAYHKFYGQSN